MKKKKKSSPIRENIAYQAQTVLGVRAQSALDETLRKTMAVSASAASLIVSGQFSRTEIREEPRTSLTFKIAKIRAT